MNRSIFPAKPLRAPAVIACPYHRSRQAGSRSGFTLIEMLVALAITLIMMGAVVTLFGVVSDSVSASRSLIEIQDRLRSAREILQQDLQGVTAKMTPPLRPENNQGYFEIIEGPMNDGSAAHAELNDLFGDVDDVLMFTTSRPDAPFIGKARTSSSSPQFTIESPYAEVIYFVVQDGPIIDAAKSPPIRLCSLYRRVRLIAPQVGPISTAGFQYFTYNDISARFDSANSVMIPNTLGDLTKRENRFAHYGIITYKEFPFLVNTARLPWIDTSSNPVQFGVPRDVNAPSGNGFASHPSENAFLAPFDPSSPRYGDDRLLTNVLAFDVQVFDPDAPVVVDGNGLVVPSNTPTPNEYTSRIGSAIAAGDYVDLGYAAAIAPPSLPLANVVNDRSGLTGQLIYDTWSEHYESDGLDQHNDSDIDAATNGLDDNGNDIIDDADERETMPPYSAPLRGIKVTIRVYETSSKQVREAVVIQNFNTK
jgi:prepilin-type N-terminal cleavage/methylation domain-containing protein